MYSKSDNIEIMINNKVDEVIEELFQSLLCRYQIGLVTSLIVFIYNFYKINPDWGELYKDSLKWIKIKKQ